MPHRITITLTPVHKIMSPTYRFATSTATVRLECWEAHSTDGLWTYSRERGAPGTPWMFRHEPSEFASTELFGSLTQARAWTARPEVWAGLWADAQELLRLREIVDPVLPVGDHDRARALLTWIAERGLHPAGTLRPVDRE